MITVKTYRLGINFFSINLPKKAKILAVHAPFIHRPELRVLVDSNSTETETRNFLSATVDESYPVDIESLEYLGTYVNTDLFEVKVKKLFK